MTSWEKIGTTIDVCVSKNHTFGTDSFLLADFANPKRKDTVCDLCSGCGIIPLLWMRSNSPEKVYGVELQEEAVLQMNSSVNKNQLQERFVPLKQDLREIRNAFPAGSMDLVTCNPPYKTVGSGIPSATPDRLTARHETDCTMQDVCQAVSWLLRFGGRFCVCQLPERLSDVFDEMRKNNLEPKRLRMVQNTPTCAPWLVLVEGKRGAKPSLIIEPPLIMRGLEEPSEDIKRIYKDYGKV